MSNSFDLIEACKSGYFETVVGLLKRNFTVHVRDSKQATPLYYSACQGFYDICRILIQSGSDINATVQWGSTALHAAADRGHIECVKLLIHSGADLSVQNRRGDTALHLSAYRGHIEIVKVFIQHNCNLFIKNNNEKTASDEAEGNNHHNTAALLRQHMIAVESGNENGFITIGESPKHSHNTIPGNAHIPCTTPISPSRAQAGNDNFVRYSSDYTKFTRQSAPITNVCVLEESSSKQHRPISDPILSNTDITHIRPENGHPLAHDKSRYGQHSSYVGQNGALNMLDNNRLYLQLQGREAMENFAETLQIQVMKKHDECEEKDKQIKQLQEAVRRQDEKLKAIGLSYVRLQDEHEKQKLSGVNNGNPNCDKTYDVCTACHCRVLKVLTCLKQRGQSLEQENSLLTLKGALKLQYLNTIAPTSLDIPNKEWKVGKDFILLGDKPLNYQTEEDRNGSCSLVFLINHNRQEFVLKMMINLINLQAIQHGDGHSLDQFLTQNFGSEHIIPANLPYHPNVISVRHHYMGATDRFKKFINLLIPARIDVQIEMASRTSFLVMDRYPQTLKDFMVHQRTLYPKTKFGLDVRFIMHLLYQILSAIHHLQKNGVVHRDIKADNIFLDNLLRPILTDFGFAKTVRSKDGKSMDYSDSRQIYAGNSHAWAPELTRYSRQELTQRGGGCSQTTTLQDVYGKADAYAVGRMFYSLLRPLDDGDQFPQSSVHYPHYDDSDIPELPSSYSNGLRWVLHNLVLDDPVLRMSEHKAMLCVGMMLFHPNDDELRIESDTITYYQARIFSLLSLADIDKNTSKETPLTMEQSIKVLTPVLESHFLYNSSTSEFWETYQFLKVRSLL